MSPAFLRNTNILSDLIRHPRGTVAARIAATGEDTVCTSIVVAAELRFGAAQSGSAELVSRVDRILSTLEVLPLGCRPTGATARYVPVWRAMGSGLTYGHSLS